MNIKVRFIVFFLTLTGISNAGAWLQNQGDYLFTGSIFAFQSCNYWNGNGLLGPSPCFNSFAASPYIEYGLDSNFNIGGGLFAQQARQSTNNYTLSNGQLFGKYKFWASDYSVFAGQITGYVPFYNTSTSNTDIGAYSLNVFPNNFNFEARLLYGTGGPLKNQLGSGWYINLEAGLGNSINNYGQTTFVIGSVGWKSNNEKFVVELKSMNTFNFNDQVLATYTPPYNYYQLYSLSPSILFNFNKNLGLQFGIYQDLAGSNIGQGTTIFSTLYWRSFK